jgi:hypothetical protein
VEADETKNKNKKIQERLISSSDDIIFGYTCSKNNNENSNNNKNNSNDNNVNSNFFSDRRAPFNQ